MPSAVPRRTSARSPELADELDHEEVLGAAEPYLGKCPSTRSEWTPPAHGHDSLWESPDGGSEAPWQFENVPVS